MKSGKPKAKLRAAGKPTGAPSPSRVIIDCISPNIDAGRFAAKCSLGKSFTVEATLLCDGHEILKADILYRHESETEWTRRPMDPLVNDGYAASFTPDRYGTYFYTVEAAIDRFAGWRYAYFKKADAGEATEIDRLAGLEIMRELAGKAGGPTPPQIARFEGLEDASQSRALLSDDGLEQTMRSVWDDPSTVRFAFEFKLNIDAPLASFSSWYEFFPRSKWKGIAEQGNLRDAADRLDYVADLGFDILYLPPIHPIGVAFRKGRNNTLTPEPGDVGSPWAIGGKEGGHKSIHPDLGTFADFDHLVQRARSMNIEIALDIAFQCSPDHPYVTEHPEWFKKRADGSIQYAENPPKKYQDIYPFDFECDDWKGLWDELLSVLQFWVDKGVRVFRVDNPHTKAFPFWEFAIAAIREKHPETVFLAEAFTRPHVMAYLAKIGFSQSYTYFAWRHQADELKDYMDQLTKTELKDYFRPNFWPNTPDILTRELQTGNRGLYMQRLILAATLTANYGIYGPAFELMESAPAIPGKEEYLDSEKYQVREWDVDAPHSLRRLIKRVNGIRRDHAALQANDTLMFHPTSNPQLMAYTKSGPGHIILTVVNLDPVNRQAGTVDLQIHKLGISQNRPYTAHDLLTNAHYSWQGWQNYVELDPNVVPAHILKIDRPDNEEANDE